MRILKVSLSNLNSLKGEHEVDFTKGSLANAGLYAITGPTGSGKTTLLDAITLALFGKAARYGNERNPEEVMSRGTGECRAEVLFETRKGQFTARWSLARARGKADGKVQQPSRKIIGAKGKIVTDQLREADEKILELSGLDYDRFMRSVMLAQGQFAKFLASKPNERAELLESMTGTDLYSRLGILAFEEAKERAEGIATREQALETIELLGEEERADIKERVAAADKTHAGLKAEQAKLAPFVGKIAMLDKALGKIEERQDGVGEAEEAMEDMADDLESLARHRLTEPFAAPLAEYDTARKTLERRREEYLGATQDKETAAETLGLALAEHRQSVEAELAVAREAVGEREQEHKDAVQEHAEAKAWLEENKHLEKLAPAIAKLTAAGKGVDAAVDKLDGATKAWFELPQKSFPKASRAFPRQVDEVAGKQLAQAVEACAEELRANIAAAAARLPDLRKIEQLAEARLTDARAAQRYAADRAKLKDGAECPLCGSTHHNVRHTGPVVSVDAIERELQKARAEVEAARDLERQGGQELKDLLKAGSGLVAAQAAYVAARDAFAKLCEEHDIDPEEGVDDDALHEEVTEYTDAKAELKDKLNAIGQALRDIADAKKEVGRFQDMLAKLKTPPAGVRLGKPGKRAKPLAEAEKAADKAHQAFRKAEADVEALVKPFGQAEKAHADAKRVLESKLGKSDFDSVEDLLEAKLEEGEVKRLNREKEAAEKRLNQARADLKASQEAVAALRKEKVPEGAAAKELMSRFEGLKTEADEALREVEAAKNELRVDDDNRARRAKLLKEIEKELATIQVWRQLSELIGSADGAKFRKFAQSITLDILMGHANRHMGRLNDRYALLRDPDPDAELALIVEDRYQGGQRRPMASLSGGESFLASLALALGLSDLAGKSVRIESLFIDEGFGTLDPETLDIALDALEGLRQGNKSIGVISHVGLLKERISTQIVVHKSASGHSTLEIIGA